MALKDEILGLIKKARETSAKRNFTQSFEFVMTLKGLDPKKDRDVLNINEVIVLKNPFSHRPKVCAIATGELALRLKESGLVDRILSSDDVDVLAANKRSSRKLAREFDFFVAETSLMPKVGRALGPVLGPRGKMPTPIPPAAGAVDVIVGKLMSSTRIRSRGQLSISCKIGFEDMTDAQVAENALSVFEAVEKKLPQGRRNIRSIIVKLTMGPVTRVAVVA